MRDTSENFDTKKILQSPQPSATRGHENFKFVQAKIEKRVDESPSVRSFYLNAPLPSDPKPGQFLMVWLPNSEEVPMSVSGHEGGITRISVAKVGPTTEKIHKLNTGDFLWVRGPFGSWFKLDANFYLLVAGGYGSAPLVYAAKALSRSGKKGVYAIGAKNKSELLFLDEARDCGFEVFISTEDGSSGRKGVVTDMLDDLFSKFKFDSILTCGPEKMMFKVIKEGFNRGIYSQASLERYMKCGFGICGSCVLDPLGLRVCVEGPVFDSITLLKTEFGSWRRSPSGRREKI
jgi:dihydroorotate dehydrogenase electron transfer subunit